MMKLSMTLLLASLLLADPAPAAVVNVYGPADLSAGFGTKTYSFSFNGDPRAVSSILIQNGSGQDIVLRTCSGNILARLVCELENAARLLIAALDRPNQIDIRLNNVLIASQAQLPPTKGSLQMAVSLKASNRLDVKLGSLPTQHLKITIRSEASIPNQAPIASFQISPSSGSTLDTIGFDATLSRDPDGRINNYFWDFGDGQTATGMIAAHRFVSGGTFNVKLTVTDDQGAQASQSQSIVIRADVTPPVLAVNLPAQTLTRESSILIPVQVSDANPGTTQVFANNVAVYSTADLNFSYLLSLPSDQEYVIRVESRDSFGNLARSADFRLVRDTLGPVLSSLSPAANANLTSRTITVSGQSNEVLSEVSINGVAVSLAVGASSFSAVYEARFDGTVQLVVLTKDVAGNQSQTVIPVNINSGANDLWSYQECPVSQ